MSVDYLTWMVTNIKLKRVLITKTMSTTSGFKKGKKFSKPFKCWFCGDLDPKHNCTKMFCSLCGTQGHRASKCTSRPSEQDKSKIGQQKITMMADSDVEGHAFYFDSGASHHITRDRSLLHNYKCCRTTIKTWNIKSRDLYKSYWRAEYMLYVR